MATATDFIKSALRKVNSYQSGETLAAPDMQDCLDTFNDLLDSWSASEDHVAGVSENIVQWIAGQNQYSVGNPVCTDLGSAPFQGLIVMGTNVITGANVPNNLLVGATLSSLQNLFPSNTRVIAIDAPGGIVTLSQFTTGNSIGNDTLTYTVPGDFAFERPLMITSGFTRFSQLDFTLDVFASQEEYNAILYKAQPGPWPTVAWYNNTYPYGTLSVYQTPGNSSELHLFTQTILNRLSANSVIVLPQGYARAVKLALAREIWVEYVSPMSVPTMLEKLANEAVAVIKELNAKPAQRTGYDLALIRGNRADGGWIFSGGYR